ncbi:MAG: phosphoglycerate mutase [Mizugakiibacter sp.]|uniref:phosphoglycerate mutase n=1 Tax=Mizugakiibacter sp. TaxID=1972610 RepID=UPI0031BBF3CA|nr:phosphoglycerate mutase [Xanthomonadaceae bacterium]
MNALHILLPPYAQCAGIAALAQLLARADRLADAAPGYAVALGEYFRWPGATLPAAALLRQRAVGDAEGATWLCADPAYVRPDINGARMLACGSLDLSRAEAEALARELKPVFGDSGALLETTTPARWHLRLPAGAVLPAFAAPEDVLGADLFEHLPEGNEGRRWRQLFNEAQVILHQNPVNAERHARGAMPANSLWFWGGGALPAWVKSPLAVVASDDELALALAARAGVDVESPRPQALAAARAGAALFDLERVAAEALARDWLPALADALARGRATELRFVFCSGERHRLARWHRLRFWRRARTPAP